MPLPEPKKHTGVWCRMCDAERREGNSWLRAFCISQCRITSEPNEEGDGYRYVKLDMMPNEERSAAFLVTRFEDHGPGDAICGSDCLLRYYGAWEEQNR